MESYNGIISLLIASFELLLFLNILKFAEKTKVNWMAIGMVGLLFGYQLLETLICFFGINDQWLIYLAFVVISYLPPLGLLLVLNFAGINNKFINIIFIPAIFFTIYYATVIPQFNLTICEILYAEYSYPLGDLYGVFYYLPVFLTLILTPVYYSRAKFGMRKKLWRILMIGYYVPFVPGIIMYLFMPGFVDAAESGLCKLAFVLAIAMSYFSIANRKEI